MGAKGSEKKNHKYISRFWKNGKWFYRYKITGQGYKDDAINYRKQSADAVDDAQYYNKRLQQGKGYTYSGHNNTSTLLNEATVEARSKAKMAENAEKNYKNKSVKGLAESTVSKGKEAIGKLFKGNKSNKKSTSSNSNTFTLGSDGQTQAPSNGKWRKVK